MRSVLVDARRPAPTRTHASLPVRELAGVAVVLLALAASPCARAEITNGSFETGDFTGFTRGAFFADAAPNTVPNTLTPGFSVYRTAFQTGPSATDSNAVLSSQTSDFSGIGPTGTAIVPTNGSMMAFLDNDTSAGDGTLTGSHIFQTFTVSSNATMANAQLVFDVALLNDEPDTVDFANFNDFGGVALVQGSGIGGTILADYVMDLNPNSSANAHVIFDTEFGGFWDSTPLTNNSPFSTQSFSLSGLDNQTVTLVAYVANAGQNSGESRLLLDNLRILTTGAVPEPSSIALLMLGGVLMCRKWRRAAHSFSPCLRPSAARFRHDFFCAGQGIWAAVRRI